MPKKKTPPAGKLEFHGLQLIESASRLGKLRRGELPSKATQAVQLALIVDDDGKSAMVNARFKLDAAYEGSKTKDDPPFSVFAKYMLSYSITEAFPSKQRLEHVIERVVMLNVWPYWREFVHSMTLRMGLPAFPVPLFYMSELAKHKPKVATEKPK